MAMVGRLRKLREAAASLKPVTINVNDLRPPVRDPYLHYPRLMEVRKAIRGGDWPAATALLRALPPEGLVAAADVLAESPDLDVLLPRVLDDDPSDIDARALLAARMWTSGDPDRRADAMLLDTLTRDPSHVIAGTWRLRTIGRQDPDEVVRRYAEFEQHHRDVYTAQHHVLQGLLPKSGGTWERAWAFLGRIVADAPPGSPSPTLIADFHIERWKGTGTSLSDPGLQEDMVRAAEASVLHPSYKRTTGWVRVHNSYAFAFTQGGNFAHAGRIFTVLNNQMSRAPWDYLGTPEQTFSLERERCQLMKRS